MEASAAPVLVSAGVDFWLAVLGLVSGLVGIVLSFVAIAQSLYFFRQSKTVETVTISALEGIKAQTGTLAEISGQQLKGLTQIVREQVRSPDRGSAMLAGVMERVVSMQLPSLLDPSISTRKPEGNAIDQHGVPNLPPEVDRAALRDAAATAYLAIYYYASHTNLLAQLHLPREEEYVEGNEVHRFVRNLLDMSFNDFKLVGAALDDWARTDAAFLAGHRLHASFGVQGQRVKAIVKNSRQRFEEMKAVQQVPEA